MSDFNKLAPVGTGEGTIKVGYREILATKVHEATNGGEEIVDFLRSIMLGTHPDSLTATMKDRIVCAKELKSMLTPPKTTAINIMPRDYSALQAAIEALPEAAQEKIADAAEAYQEAMLHGAVIDV